MRNLKSKINSYKLKLKAWYLDERIAGYEAEKRSCERKIAAYDAALTKLNKKKGEVEDAQKVAASTNSKGVVS